MPIDAKELTIVAHAYAKAWCSGDPESVASFFAENGQIVINQGDVHSGRSAVAEMAAGFYAEFPDLVVLCDEFRTSGNHALFAWTLEGHHSKTNNFVRAKGWEEWDLDDDMKVVSSRGWFDALDYDAQIVGSGG